MPSSEGRQIAPEGVIKEDSRTEAATFELGLEGEHGSSLETKLLYKCCT